MENQRGKFCARMLEVMKTKGKGSTILTADEYKTLVNELERIKEFGPRASTSDYRKRALYEVRSQRIYKRNSNTMLVHIDEYFNIINTVHAATHHGGRDVMLAELKNKYSNVPRVAVMTYLNFCENCQMKKNKPKKEGLVVKPILSNAINSRCQVDLIDWQTLPAGQYKYIFVYQDHLTKFIQLRPQVATTAKETACNVLDIICIFGAPFILQSGNGREFANKVVKEMKSLWPECHIVHGMPHHSQSQGSVERANEDIEIKLRSWMRDNKTTNWVEGLRFVQLNKNRCLNSGIGRSPYAAMFGSHMQLGLSDSILPADAINGIETEEDLDEKLAAFNNNMGSHETQSDSLQ